MQVKDLTTEELKALIRETVIDTIQEVLDDPDKGRELKENIRQQLIEMRSRREAGSQRISSEEAMQRLGLSGQ
ncbi:MAG: hypothetical protein ACAF41_30915 [Leptolyngbya sp. BL-A-14]